MPVPIYVFAAVVERESKFLVCRRPLNKRHGGLWEFPGGKREPGESRLDAARRELTEELGVTVETIGTPLLAVGDAGSDFVIEFVPTAIQGEPECLEHSELRWAPLAGLSELDLAPSDRKFVDLLVAARREIATP